MKYIAQCNTVFGVGCRIDAHGVGESNGPAMRSRIATLLFVVGLGAGACSGPAGSSSPASASSANAVDAAVASHVPLPGNSVTTPLPTDAPPSVVSRAPLRACGAEVLFEEDVDITPIPTSPWAVTSKASNQAAVDCLIDAWQSGGPAEMVTAEISDEADEIFTIYRLPGDATVQVITRVWSHTDKVVDWTSATCKQLSDQAGVLTPADCASEVRIN